MADIDISFRQHAVIEFLVKEEKSAAEIHLRLQHAYGDVCMGASSVRRWVKHFKDGNTSMQDEPRSGRPRTASMERNKERINEFIREDRCVTVNEIAATLAKSLCPLDPKFFDRRSQSSEKNHHPRSSSKILK